MLSGGAVTDLRAVARRFTREAAAEKASLIRNCSSAGIDDPRVLIAYHDCLLFLLAYPQTAKLQAMAAAELERVAAEAHRLVQRGRRHRRALEESGVAWSEITVAVALPIARWLAERFPHQAEVAFFGQDGRPLRDVLRFGLPQIEYEALIQDRPSEDLFRDVASEVPGSRLRWLLGAIDRLACSEEIREHLYESLHAHVRIELRRTPLSRTFCRGLVIEPFFHRGPLRREIDVRAIVDQALPPSRPLSGQERWHLIDAARGLLTTLARETDPMTLCVPGGVDFLELGRGVSVALYAMPPGRRFPIDTHLGFVVFKNAVPVAYGGGWPFLGLCRIGIHLFEPYRGGESGHLFAQVLRAYRQRFGVKRFVVESRQFGIGEPDGIRSGAFWFYHRLGFRPVEPRLARLAEAEVALAGHDGSYRSPRSVLRRLAGSDLELVLPGGAGPIAHCEPAALSLAVSGWIGRVFDGDRAAAERAAVDRVSAALAVQGWEAWPEPERLAYRELALLVAQVPDLERWPARERRSMVAIMRAKGAPDEAPYFRRLLSHPRLGDALVRLASSVGS